MGRPKPVISAIIIAKNEEKRIERCLRTLSWVDEIIFVDNGSEDQTVNIAKKYNAKVAVREGIDFQALRNTGRMLAKGEWLLYIDADEEVPDELQKEIKSTISTFDEKSSSHGYYIRRRNFYLGAEWPVCDEMQRLFYAKSLTRWEGKLHETAVIKGFFGKLEVPLIHTTHRTLEEMVKKTNEWSEIEAQLRYEAKHPHVSWWRLFRVIITGFTRSFFCLGGWRAGTRGWIESIYQGFSMFITYAKLWEKQVKNLND